MKHILSTGLVCLLLVGGAHAQKIKYKDLFPLLKAKNYDDADPFLRKFLIQEPDHPDANYRMGKMLAYYLQRIDILKEHDQVPALADSAVLYLDRAAGLLTEKYVKKHDDDYYVSFRRRDLRTGKFEVKHSDVELDIEETRKIVEEIRKGVAAFVKHLNKARTYYITCQQKYLELAKQNDSLVYFYFTATPDDLATLRNLAAKYDSTKTWLDEANQALNEIPGNKLQIQYEEKPITHFPKDGKSVSNFFAENINLWQYGAWAQQMLDKIGKEIYPLKKRMIEYCARLDELALATARDTVDARADIFQLATANIAKELDEYVPESLPAAIFDYRLGEINYRSTANYWLTQIKDTSDIGLKLSVLADLQTQLANMEKLVEKLKNSNTEIQRALFADFIQARFGSPDSLGAFIEHEIASIARDKEWLAERQAEVLRQDSYAYWQGDSIALVAGMTGIGADTLVQYYTLLVDTLSERERAFYAIRYRQKLSFEFVFGVAPSSRQPDTLYTLAIDKKTGLKKPQETGFISVAADSLLANPRLFLLYAKKENKQPSQYQLIITDLTAGPLTVQQHKLKQPVQQVVYDEFEKAFVLLDAEENELLRLPLTAGVVKEE